MITDERRNSRVDELLSVPCENLNAAELDELMTLLNIDVDEQMSKIYVYALESLKLHPCNPLARMFCEQYEAKARKKLDNK